MWNVKKTIASSIYGDVIVRRECDFTCADFGESGIIQTLSILPLSYPGHSLLTEDEDLCREKMIAPCGRLGKYFKVTGRIKSSEIRGVVILMNPKIENSEFITLSNHKNLSVLLEEKPLNIFSDLVVQYLDNLSFVLRKNPKSKNYSDVTSFAFFCRKANINRLKAEYLESPQKIRKGRGLAFHMP